MSRVWWVPKHVFYVVLDVVLEAWRAPKHILLAKQAQSAENYQNWSQSHVPQFKFITTPAKRPFRPTTARHLTRHAQEHTVSNSLAGGRVVAPGRCWWLEVTWSPGRASQCGQAATPERSTIDINRQIAATGPAASNGPIGAHETTEQQQQHHHHNLWG